MAGRLPFSRARLSLVATIPHCAHRSRDSKRATHFHRVFARSFLLASINLMTSLSTCIVTRADRRFAFPRSPSESRESRYPSNWKRQPAFCLIRAIAPTSSINNALRKGGRIGGERGRSGKRARQCKCMRAKVIIVPHRGSPSRSPTSPGNLAR